MTELSTRKHDVAAVPRQPDGLQALEEENAQLRAALAGRIVIEQAKGAVSARLDTTPEVAFELMRGLARSQRRSMDEFAAEIVANGGRLSPER
jgi:AmiR/NasT family two-component response regulator